MATLLHSVDTVLPSSQKIVLGSIVQDKMKIEDLLTVMSSSKENYGKERLIMGDVRRKE